MERFLLNYGFISVITQQIKTGECMPVELFAKLKASQCAFSAYPLLEALAKAYFDYKVCVQNKDCHIPVRQICEEIMREVLVVPPSCDYFPENGWHHMFSEASVYAGKMFSSYRIGEMYASAYYHKIVDVVELMNEIALRYRRQILETGGLGKPEEFLGGMPDSRLFLLDRGIVVEESSGLTLASSLPPPMLQQFTTVVVTRGSVIDTGAAAAMSSSVVGTDTPEKQQKFKI